MCGFGFIRTADFTYHDHCISVWIFGFLFYVRMDAQYEPYGALVTYVWDPSGVLLHLAQWDAP